VDRWSKPPQAAAFSGPWRKHLWTAGASRPKLLHSQFHGGNICGPLVHPAPSCCILRSMEQTFVDHLCTPPQAAAFSSPWINHLWSAGASCPRPLHSQVHGANICGPLVHPAPGRCILRSMEQTSIDSGAHSQIHGANIYGPLVHPAQGRCIVRFAEEISMDRWCTMP
jgi:hypothetical protein